MLWLCSQVMTSILVTNCNDYIFISLAKKVLFQYKAKLFERKMVSRSYFNVNLA